MAAQAHRPLPGARLCAAAPPAGVAGREASRAELAPGSGGVHFGVRDLAAGEPSRRPGAAAARVPLSLGWPCLHSPPRIPRNPLAQRRGGCAAALPPPPPRPREAPPAGREAAAAPGGSPRRPPRGFPFEGGDSAPLLRSACALLTLMGITWLQRFVQDIEYYREEVPWYGLLPHVQMPNNSKDLSSP
ncbi:retinoic acid receptor RXR-beta-like [Phalacrocorax carbo]|uniref:retinoic acid receptor RXR-beta-like n=1 Tax=Phalacrocorax carbo TaxID=9209 RepID=UPI00311A06D4